MEKVSMLCLLLLLLRSLSGAELQDQSSPENVNVPEQTEPIHSDLDVILREMRATLAEHKVRIDLLQTLNEEQAAKLKEFEKQVNSQQQAQATEVNVLRQQQQVQAAELNSIKTRANVTENQVEFLSRDRAEQAAKLRELEQQTSEVDSLKMQQQAQSIEMDTLKEQQEAQASDLRGISTRTSVTENHVESLRKDRAARQVAFSASLLASGSGNVGPFNTHTTLVFKYIFSNIGNAYNKHTGFFTAPVRGAYHFEFHVGAIGHSSRASIAALMKNERHICNAYEHQTNGFGTSANGATLLLEAGDVVSLRLWANTVIHDSENHHSTFTGFLLFPL